MSFSKLPLELLLQIIAFSVEVHPVPSTIARLNSYFFGLCLPLLHTHLRFRSVSQLVLFSSGTSPLSCPPKSISISRVSDFHVFHHLLFVLVRCRDVRPESTQVELDELYLCLHSHARNPKLELIYDALTLANPKTFTWTGPDPEHHFSTAIVPAACPHLFRAIRTWSHLTHIQLTNVAFPAVSANTLLNSFAPTALFPFAESLSSLPSIRTICIGQATFLPLAEIAMLIYACTLRPGSLEEIRLVDTYRESIWGSRIRRRDVEKAILHLTETDTLEGMLETSVVLDRVKKLVRCEAKTERIMGGDRVEGLSLLD